MRTLARLFLWIAEVCIDLHDRLMGYPPEVDWTSRPDTSRAPFHLPPDTEPTNR